MKQKRYSVVIVVYNPKDDYCHHCYLETSHLTRAQIKRTIKKEFGQSYAIISINITNIRRFD